MKNIFVIVLLICIISCSGSTPSGESGGGGGGADLAQAFNGKCDDTKDGSTFSYTWLQDTIKSEENASLTLTILDCIAKKSLESPKYSGEDCILKAAVAEFAKACVLELCPNGSPVNAEGKCTTTADDVMCPDGTVPEDGDCSNAEIYEPSVIMCSDGSAPVNGACPAVAGTQATAPLQTDTEGSQPTETTPATTPVAVEPAEGDQVAASEPAAGVPAGSDGVPAEKGEELQPGQEPSPTEPVAKGDEVAPQGPSPEPEGAICANCSLKFTVKYPSGYNGDQLHQLVRKYITSYKDGSTTMNAGSGDLYLRLCADQECKDVKYLKKVATVYMPSTGKTYEYAVTGLPKGTYYAQLVLDTDYSEAWKSPCVEADVNSCPGPFDLVQMKVPAGSDPSTFKMSINNDGNPSHNPAADSANVTISTGAISVGTAAAPILIGSFVFDRSFYITPPKEDGYVMAATSGDGYRNIVRVLNLNSYKVEQQQATKYGTQDFDGDICGFVPAQKETVYAMGYGHGKCGAYAFKLKVPETFGTSKVEQIGDPIFIPHPDNTQATQDPKKCETFDIEKIPHPCRGTFVNKGTAGFLYLVEFKGAGSLGSSLPYPIMGIDLSTGKLIEKGAGLSIYKDAAEMVFRSVAVTGGNYLYILEASWGKKNTEKVNKIRQFSIGVDGKLTTATSCSTAGCKDIAISAGTANMTCGQNYPPAFAGYYTGGKPYLAVGSDTSINFYKFGAASRPILLKSVDTSAYGKQFTNFALSPDGKQLSAISTCNAEKFLNIPLGKSGTTTPVDRQLVAVFDLTGTTPKLMYVTHDFNGDGIADGGVDVQSTNIKANAMKWMDNASGIVPPVVITGPQIAVSPKALFLHGTGIQGGGGACAFNSSGLGQLADMGIHEIASGNVMTFRDYTIWLNGPGSKELCDDLAAAARWGYDMDAAKGELSTGAIMFVGPGMQWPK